MKTTNKILALAIMAVAMVYASCNKDDNDPVGPTQQEIEAKIVGKWKRTLDSGKEVLTNSRNVNTYVVGGVMYSSFSQKINGQWEWANQTRNAYSVVSNDLHQKSLLGESFAKVLRIDDASMQQHVYKTTGKGVDYPVDVLQDFQRVTTDYSQDIIGMWEGTAMTGYETYGDYHHRIEYRADGTYTYYSWDESTQTWQPLEDVFDEWNVDGDWLATRWQNNGSDVMNYEWWDIDYIKKEGNDIIMKWSALREKEDGERFTTTFTWKKVK